MSTTAKSAPGLLKSAGTVSASISVSRITGLVRESVLSWLFGAGAIYDSYVLGFRIPSLARELFAEGALSSAFVPTFTRYVATKSHAEARELSNVTGTLLLLTVGAFCVLGMIFSPALVDLFAPEYHAIPGKFELATSLVRTMFPFLLLLALSAQAQGILYATHRFAVPAVSPGAFNVGSVLFGLILGYWFGPRFGITAVKGMAFGVVLGGVTQLVFLLPGVWRAGFAWRPQLNLRHEGVRHILSLMGPALIGNASGQINILVNTNFASGLRDAAGHVMNGPVSWLAYAYRFFILPMGIFGVAIASAALPRLSRSVAHRNLTEFGEILSRSILMILLLTIPASVGLATIGESMIGIVYQHGHFLASDTHQTALALSYYAVGLAGYSTLKLIAPAFYALGDSRTPMFVSLGSVFVNAISAYMFVHVAHFGAAGLALTTSIAATFSSVMLLVLLRARLGSFNTGDLLLGVLKTCVAASLMGFICHLVVLESHALIRSPFLARIVDIAIGVPVGAASFYGFASLLRIPEIEEARATILGKFRGSS